MKIIIIANFPARIDGSKEKGRFLYLGEMLCERGHDVTMLVSDFNHGTKKHRGSTEIKHEAYQTKIIALHEPGYPNNISIKRLWSHFVWGRNVGKFLNDTEKPDVIYCAVPSLTAAIKVARYCKSAGPKFTIDVQDLWPEAFQMAVRNKLLQRALKPIDWYVNKIYRAADVVVAVSDTYVKRVLKVNAKVKDGYSIYLGNDGALFDASRGESIEERNNKEIKLAYIGTLGYSYDLKCVIDAIDISKPNEWPQIVKFVIMGDGPMKDELIRYAQLKRVECEFTGSLPYQEMVKKLCECDIVVNPIKSGSAASIINKVGDYALSGLPVINTQESPEYRKLLEQYKCGINCRVGNAQDVADAIVKLSKNPELRKQMGENARRLGEERFDRRQTYKQIVEVIEESNV